MNHMYKIGVLGDKDSVMGFAALGLSVAAAETPEEARQLFREMSGGEYAVLYVTERLAQILEDEIAACRDSMLPAVIPIPDNRGSLSLGLEQVKKNIERAVGSDIIGG